MELTKGISTTGKLLTILLLFFLAIPTEINTVRLHLISRKKAISNFMQLIALKWRIKKGILTAWCLKFSASAVTKHKGSGACYYKQRLGESWGNTSSSAELKPSSVLESPSLTAAYSCTDWCYAGQVRLCVENIFSCECFAVREMSTERSTFMREKECHGMKEWKEELRIGTTEEII